MIKITVMGEPVPAARPRFGGRRVYQPKRNADYRTKIQSAAYSAMAGRLPMTGEVGVILRLYRRYKPTTRLYGDCDNLLKAVLDGLNRIVFEDDSQVVRCSVEKFQDKANPRAEVTIRKLQG